MLNTRQTHGRVVAGDLSEDESVLGDWSGLADASLAKSADILLGLAPVGPDGREAVVSVYDVTPDEDGKRWTRTPEGKVRFHGVKSSKYAYLLGHVVPEPVFSRRGMARAAVYVDTHELPAPPSSSTPEEVAAGGVIRAHGVTIRVGDDGVTVVEVPVGKAVKVLAVTA